MSPAVRSASPRRPSPRESESARSHVPPFVPRAPGPLALAVGWPPRRCASPCRRLRRPACGKRRVTLCVRTGAGLEPVRACAKKNSPVARPLSPLAQSPELSRVIDTIKARVPLEEVVRECIEGEFVQRGAKLWCTCPFHDEKTPSFQIDPARGFWYCFGACGEGGDLISFVQKRHQTEFWDTLEWLAARANVELPQKGRKGPRRDDPAYAVLEGAEKLYRARLFGPEGRIALEYLRQRGISDGAIEAFGLGFAPAHGRTLLDWAQQGQSDTTTGWPSAARQGADGLDLLVATGLVRRGDDGRPYDFFRGRLMIPIRDDRGRTVAFGARRLDRPGEEPKGPKYINTPETPWFHKGRLIYGYDRAADAVRRGGHLVLMEGYTDVICTHQAGVPITGAVLGTATTEDHARLIRRAGTRRVTLVFDGDEAGRRAAWKALRGLLPLEIDLDVAVPPAGQDPADLVAGGHSGPLMALLEQADPWLDFVITSLDGLQGRALSQGIDRILELLGAIPKPVHLDACVKELARAVDVPVESLREQYRQLPTRRAASRHTSQRAAGPEAGSSYGQSGAAMGVEERSAGGMVGSQPEAAPAGSQQENRTRSVDPRLKKAYKGVLGAALCDTSLIPQIRPLLPSCELPAARAVLQAMIQVWDSEDLGEIAPQHIMNALGDHAIRNHLVSMMQYVEQAEDAQELLRAELRFLELHAIQREKQELLERVQTLGTLGDLDPDAEAESTRCLTRMGELNQRCLELEQVAVPAGSSPEPRGSTPASPSLPSSPDPDPF